MQVTLTISFAKLAIAASVTDVNYDDECQKGHKRGGGVVIFGNFARVELALI